MNWFIVFIFTAWILAYYKIAFIRASLTLFVLAVAYYLLNGTGLISYLLLVLTGTALLVGMRAPLRRRLITEPVFNMMKRELPVMSQTEREALDAGNTWWDAELFSGRLNWPVLFYLPPTRLTQEEQAFIDGPIEQLCAMLDDWDITHKRKDLPPEVWDFIKQNKVLGMIIPKKYGGLDFSNVAHSQVVVKISSRCSSAAVTMMVPNSLGPAKLLLEYGTEQQKDHYLPKLAIGEEMPCFALTGPHAGSDAGAMPDTGIVCRATFHRKKNVLGIRLNWEKRYITLSPVATVIGLAFKLYDPQHLLGDTEEIGITVALIPAGTKGVSVGRRHLPLEAAFQFGPNWGKDVFIPMDWVIGGIDQVGKGWTMLMQCLATGRSLSLPALSVGASKFTCRNTGAYARIRKQFNIAIGEFEGIEEVLSRMAGQTYILDAARSVTAAALDNGEKPSVISAMIKYELTERMRRVVNDGMDIQGGSGICLGPRNYLGSVYQAIPISITVEGANILTRTMMIFGQGAIRCHPFIQQEMQAVQSDVADALQQFDSVLFQHIGYVLHNLAAGFWLGLSNARSLKTPGDQNSRPYYRQLARLSVSFALLADYALMSLGGSLKRKERICGVFADALSNLYLCSTVLKHFQDQGSHDDDLPLMHWACQQTLYDSQQALMKLFRKLPVRPIARTLQWLLFPTGKPNLPPGERLIQQTARLLLDDSEARDRLTDGIYINERKDDPTGRIELAFAAVLKAAPVEVKLRLAQRQKQLPKGNPANYIDDAVSQNIISRQEAILFIEAEQARDEAINVDHFDQEELSG